VDQPRAGRLGGLCARDGVTVALGNSLEGGGDENGRGGQGTQNSVFFLKPHEVSDFPLGLRSRCSGAARSRGSCSLRGQTDSAEGGLRERVIGRREAPVRLSEVFRILAGSARAPYQASMIQRGALGGARGRRTRQAVEDERAAV
jgi:hypothetical protein